MPDCLRRFLEALSEGENEEVHEYLDGNEDAVAEMVQSLQQSFA